jgi:hypothetical protein
MITLEVTPGELLDRIGILELKLSRCHRPDQKTQLRAAVERARTARRAAHLDAPGLAQLERELAATNDALWSAEDEIRAREQAADHGDAFVAVARSICVLNDRRAALKRSIDNLCGFPTTDEKTYRSDRPTHP